MGLVSRLFERRASSTLANPDAWLRSWFGGGCATKAGPTITDASALTISTVWGCVRAISEDVARLPFKVYQRTGAGKKELPEHPLRELLNLRPNDETSSFLLRESMTANTLLAGNSYGEIERDGAGRPVALWPLPGPKMKVDRDPATGSPRYTVQKASGSSVVLEPDQVLHLRGMGDTLMGISVVGKARESFGMTLAAEEFGARFFGQGARPSGVLKHPGRLEKAARENLQKSFQDLYSGPQAVGRTVVLQEGMEWSSTAIPPEDAQFLETRQFQVPEICRWFRMKPHKVADLSRATFSNIEQQDLEYVGDCLMGWLVRWEQEVSLKLLSEKERRAGVFVEHVVAGLLRGDLKSRYESYAVARQWGWMNPNDVLRLENMNPLPGDQGELYLVPVNMTTPEKLKAPSDTNTPSGDTKPPNPDTNPPAGDTTAPPTETKSSRSIDASALAEVLCQAQSPLLEETFERLLKAEADKASRAGAKGGLAAWSASFYPEWTETVRGALMPVLDALNRSLRAIAGREPADQGWIAGAAKQLANAHVGRSIVELMEPAAAADSIEAWKSTRSASQTASMITALTALAAEAFRATETQETAP